MPTTIELLRGQRYTGGSRNGFAARYRLDGYTGATSVLAFAAAETALLATAPATWDGMALVEYEINADGHDSFVATVKYANLELSNAGDTEYAFDVGSERRRITHARETTSYARSGQTAPNFRGAIRVDSQGEIGGADVLVPTSRFTIAKLMSPVAFTSSYQQGCENLVGKTNDATFEGRGAGTVMFLGASGSGRMGEFVRVRFEFAKGIEETRTFGTITGVVIPPFHEVWILPEKIHDASGNAIATDVKAVYVCRTADEDDFSALGI